MSQAEANLNQAQVDLNHTVITTPIDGVVISRSVDVGQTVAASFQAPVLFVIANDLTRMQVNAAVDEADIGRVQPGQDVTFRVDAYADRSFAGRVEQVRLQPQTIQNVVSYNTIITVDNSEQKLMPGMTATVSVIVRKAENVLRLPAAALRFRPEGFEAEGGRGPRSGRPSGSAAHRDGRERNRRPAREPSGPLTEGLPRRRRGDGGSEARAPPADGGPRGALVFVLGEEPEARARPRPGRPFRWAVRRGSRMGSLRAPWWSPASRAAPDARRPACAPGPRPPLPPIRSRPGPRRAGSADMAEAPVIRLEDLRKSYALGDVTVHALRGLDLRVDRGEFVAVVGASGSGKSTLMNIVGLLDRPTSGRYLLEGEDVSGFDKDRRAVLAKPRRSGSSSRTSTCSRAPPPSRTSSCPCSTTAGRTLPGSGTDGPCPCSRRSASANAPTTPRTSSRGASSSAWPSPAPS